MQNESFYRYVSAILDLSNDIQKRNVLQQFSEMLQEEKDLEHLEDQKRKIALLSRYRELSLLLFEDIPDKMVTESFFEEVARLGAEGDEKARREYEEMMEREH